jgi:hypothetical protein
VRFTVLGALLVVSCSGPGAPGTNEPSGTSPQLDAIGWLAGEWRATEGARSTTEVWVRLEDGAWLGVSRTAEAGTTTHHEVLRLAVLGGAVHYIAAPVGQATTAFRMVAGSEDGARFENPAHDFPKWIDYRREGDEVIASIGGEGSEVAASWRFARVGGSGMADVPSRICRDGDLLRLTLAPCYCAADIFCAGFASSGGVDVHVAVVDRACDACTEASGSCAVPSQPLRSVNGQATIALGDGCVDAVLPMVPLVAVD